MVRDFALLTARGMGPLALGALPDGGEMFTCRRCGARSLFDQAGCRLADPEDDARQLEWRHEEATRRAEAERALATDGGPPGVPRPGAGRPGAGGEVMSEPRTMHLTSDPITWPLPSDAPGSPEEWATEYGVAVERMRDEPDNDWAERLRLHQIAGDPPLDFKRRFMTVWYYASEQAPMPGIRPTGTDYVPLVALMDRLVSAERSRQIREGIAGAQPDTEANAPVKRRGRRPLTEDRVRADLERALAQLAERGILRPSSWEQIASEHEGLTEFGMSKDMLKIRRDRFPAPFRELVPHLAE